LKLDGKVAVITGSSQGIGAAVALGYAKEGAKVAVNYNRNGELAERVVGEIRAGGGEALAVGGDVSKARDVAKMFDVAREAFGPVDILVANAAANPRRPWYEIPESEWDLVMSVNLKGALLCAQAAYPDMKARGYGKVITLSSVMAELGTGPCLHYVTTKSGLIGFTRALAREVGRDGIRVNCVMPGAIRTEQEIKDFPDQEAVARRAAERQCLPQRGLPEDLVGTFVYLASSDSDFVTGQVINVDGGWVHY
jgi:3-oxoacyl-[acyl-carrier protein] reductase